MSKYNNKKIVFQGIKFDSKGEKDFYLLLCEKYGKDKVQLQPSFLLQIGFRYNGKKYREIKYIADFRVLNNVYDFKGVKTDVYKIKEKLFLMKYQELFFQCVTAKDIKTGNWN
jgi:hypothetical protein